MAARVGLPQRLGTIKPAMHGVYGAMSGRRKVGDYTILSRATDSQGRTQPGTPAWNPSGYLYNAVDQVKIHVA